MAYLKNRILNSVFALVFLASIAFAFSPLGGSCDYSRDCAQGYCNDSICKIPEVLEDYSVLGACNNTIDCGNGFCMSGACILPKGMSFSTFTLGAGLQSSCAGIIENCTGIWCMFCNVTWILLLVGAAAAAFITRKSGRILPLLLFTLPVVAGIVMFPFLGTILAFIEILMISFLKPALVKLAADNLFSRLKPQQAQPPEKKEEGKKEEKPPMEPLPFD